MTTGRRVPRRRLIRAVACAALVAGLGLHAGRAYVAAKGALAAVLVERAFARHLEDGAVHRPWPWADMHPVARIEVPRLGVTRHVLAGASGSSLAFGPGHVDGTAPMDAAGNRVVAGHRDTWLAFAGALRAGDRIVVTTPRRAARFVVREARVVPASATWVLDPTADSRLTLVTCWPLGGLRASTRRLVVVALEEGGALHDGSGPPAVRDAVNARN